MTQFPAEVLGEKTSIYKSIGWETAPAEKWKVGSSWRRQIWGSRGKGEEETQLALVLGKWGWRIRGQERTQVLWCMSDPLPPPTFTNRIVPPTTSVHVPSTIQTSAVFFCHPSYLLNLPQERRPCRQIQQTLFCSCVPHKPLMVFAPFSFIISSFFSCVLFY